MDNLSVHKSRDTQSVYKDLGLETIYCVPYSPQYNGIESYWFLIKQEFKKMILVKMMNDEAIDVLELIRTSIDKVSDDKVMRCA